MPDTSWIVITGSTDYLVSSKVPTFLICIRIIVIALGPLKRPWEIRSMRPFPTLILKIPMLGMYYASIFISSFIIETKQNPNTLAIH